jgi:hypothetical protein
MGDWNLQGYIHINETCLRKLCQLFAVSEKRARQGAVFLNGKQMSDWLNRISVAWLFWRDCCCAPELVQSPV